MPALRADAEANTSWPVEATDRMNRMYRWQRHIYDATRRYYLLGRNQLISGLRPAPGANVSRRRADRPAPYRQTPAATRLLSDSSAVPRAEAQARDGRFVAPIAQRPPAQRGGGNRVQGDGRVNLTMPLRPGIGWVRRTRIRTGACRRLIGLGVSCIADTPAV